MIVIYWWILCFMQAFFKKLSIILVICRAYSLPISVMSWVVPFIFGCLHNGNIKNGIIALIGIISLHLASNLFDDIVDYKKARSLIDKGIIDNFNFQKGKCAYIINGTFKIKWLYLLDFLLFLFSLCIAVFFINTTGFNLLYIIIPTAILCLLYPILGSLGFGEIIIAAIFSPLLYSGVFYVMSGNYSNEILMLSISTGFLTVAVLHNHMLLDFKYDTTNRKITLCRITGSEKNAFILLKIFIFSAYINLLIWIVQGYLSLWFLLPLITIPSSLILLNVMSKHIKNPEEKIEYHILMGPIKYSPAIPDEQKNFIIKFLLIQNLLSSFTIILCISMVLEYVCYRVTG